MLNLEHVEQTTLRYLKQVSNPLVLFDVLYEHLCQDEKLAQLDKNDLRSFLSQHELFKVIDAPYVESVPETATELAQEGFSAGPYVILETRVPTSEQLAEMMTSQLQGINEALSSALVQARERGDATTETKLVDALRRTNEIRKRLGEFEGGKAPE